MSKIKLTKINTDDIAEGKAIRLITTEKKPAQMPNGAYLFEVLDKDLILWGFFSSSSKEQSIKNNEILLNVPPMTSFYLGRKNDEIVVKIIEEGPPVVRPTGEDTHWVQDEKLEFGKHDSNGNVRYVPPKKENEIDDGVVIEETSSSIESESTKVIDIYKEPTASNYQETPEHAKEEAKAALNAKQTGEVFSLNIAERMTICCPHCEELIALGMEVSRHKVSRDSL